MKGEIMITRKLATISILITIVSLSGCSYLSFNPSSKTETGILIDDKYMNDLSKKYFSEKGIEASQEKYEAAIKEKNEDLARNIRNKVAYDLISISDYLYNKKKQDLFFQKSALDTTMQTYGLALTTGSTVSLVNTTKTYLSAAATFLNGAKSAYDDNFYASQTISTVIAVMDGRRAEVKTGLVTSLNDKKSGEFTFSQTVAYVQQYHQAGSFVDAVVDLHRTASAVAAEKEKKLSTTLGKQAGVPDK